MSYSIFSPPVLHNNERCKSTYDNSASMERSQPAAWTTNRSLLVASLVNVYPKKNDKFSLKTTQSCTPGSRCNLVSSMYHLALGKFSGISRHATNRYPGFISSTTSISTHTQPTIATTNYTHAPTVINTSIFHVQP